MTSWIKINLKFGKRLAKTAEGQASGQELIEPVTDFFYISNGLIAMAFSVNFAQGERAMKKQHPVVERSRQRLAALGHIESRTQFGGYALAVEKVVFALVSEDALYLRASEALQEYVAQQPLQPLVFRKRGSAVNLNYYRVDDALWDDARQLLALSVASLHAARQDVMARQAPRRLKDLPNLSLRMELLLHEAGVKSVRHLVELGAKQCWLRLKAINQHIGFKTLLALEGAIEGRHEATLPQAVRAELNAWYLETLKRADS